MAISSYGFILLILASLLPQSGAQTTPSGDRVAVIFDTGDAQESDLDQAMKSRANEMANVYRAAGYKIIVLDPSTNSANNSAFQKTLDQLRGVKDLQMVFTAHGANLPPEMVPDRSNYSISTFTPQELKAAVGPDNPPGAHAFSIVGSEGPATGIGLAGLRRSIVSFQAHNQGANVTLNALTCYSGQIATELSDLAHFQAFVATHASSVSDTCHRPNQASKDGEDFLHGFARGLCSGESFAQAQASAQDEYTKICSSAGAEDLGDFPFHVNLLMQPRNSAQGFIQKSCKTKKATSSKSGGSSGGSVEDQAVRAETSDLLKKEIEDLKTIQKTSCAPEQLKDYASTASAAKMELWRAISAELVAKEIPQKSSTESITQQISTLEAQFKEQDKQLHDLSSRDPGRGALQAAEAQTRQSIETLKKFAKTPDQLAKALSSQVKGLDDCLQKKGMDLTACGRPFAAVEQIFDPYSEQERDDRAKADSCLQLLDGTDKSAALKSFYACRSSKTASLGSRLDTLRYQSAETTCGLLQAKLDLDDQQVNCTEDFLQHASASGRQQLQQMVSQGQAKLASTCTPQILSGAESSSAAATEKQVK